MAGEVANDGSAFWPRQQTHNMQNIFCSFFAFTKNFLESPQKCGKRMKYEKMILLLTYFCAGSCLHPKGRRTDFEMKYFRKHPW